MNARMAVGVASLIGVAAVAGFSVSDAKKEVVASIVIDGTVPAIASVEVKLGPSMLARQPDGGPTYLALFQKSDGGMDWMRTGSPGCVRKPVDSVLPCGRGPSTLSWSSVGDLNRFPANEAQPAVNGCEPCACAVWFGEDANQDEAFLINSTLGPLLP